MDAVRGWLRSYEVFQGISGPRRDAIASAFLKWADQQRLPRSLETVKTLDEAHQEVHAACVDAFEKQRDFTSLASKALWLRYPESVPLFDSYARRALWIIGKAERGLAPLRESEREYRKFVHIRLALYQRYAPALQSLDAGGYP
jgi:hypothetical protein